MAKISFSKMGLKIKDSVKEIDVNGSIVEVKEYLPIADKLAIIEVAIAEATQENFVNPVVLEKSFNMGIVYKYSNIGFTEKQREDELKLFDTLESNGVISAIVNAIGEDYQTLLELLEDYMDKFIPYSTSFIGMLGTLVDSIPKSMSEAVAMIDEMDTGKISAILKHAMENGGNQEAMIEHLMSDKNS